MSASAQKKRIWGWIAFDWATQPFYTLGLSFIFGPYFAALATDYYLAGGMETEAAKAQAQATWTGALTIAGLCIALTAPFLGAYADNSGRKIPWIAFFSGVYVVSTWMLWGVEPDTTRIAWTLVIFFTGFIAAESALNFVNAILPSLGTEDEVGRISGTAAAMGYAGGVLSLFIMLLLLAENEEGVTLLGNAPALGLNPDAREGTRSVGPFIAIWFAVFMVPFFLWVRDDPPKARTRVSLGKTLGDLGATLKELTKRRSLGAFLLGSMFYRDALNALYGLAGVYAQQVLDWSIIQIGVFGIIGAITATIATYIGGRCDQRFGPKPVIVVSVSTLVLCAIVLVGMSRTDFYGIPIPAGSGFPDSVLYVVGATVGGMGGVVYAASRSMMVRHTDPDRPTEAFGLFALSGKATAFLAPALITAATALTGSAAQGFIPLIFLFLIGLILLRWVNKDGDREEWSVSQQSLA